MDNDFNLILVTSWFKKIFLRKKAAPQWRRHIKCCNASWHSAERM